MPDISVSIAGKKATPEAEKPIVCGNSDYTLTFSFDEEWDGLDEKTARFVFQKDGKTQCIDQPFTGNVVNVPILSGINAVLIGVYVANLKSTAPARIPCETSILCFEET